MIGPWVIQPSPGALAAAGWYEGDRPWMRAALSGAEADPFSCTPFWQLPLHEAIAPGWPLLVREDGDSALNFAISRSLFSPGLYLLPLDHQWRFASPLLGPEGIDLLEDTVRAGEYPVRAAPGDCIEISGVRVPARVAHVEISGVRAQSRAAEGLARRFGPRARFRLRSRQTLCGASLEGGLDGFLSRRSANFRKKLRQQARRAEREAISFERVCPADIEEAETVYGRMLEVEGRSWKGQVGDGLLARFPRDFYGRLLSRLSLARAGRVIFARGLGRDIGFIFGGVTGGIYRGQQFSFDADWAAFSIGHLMQFEQVRWLCEAGAIRYDMGPRYRRGMAYKAHWTELQFPMETWSLDWEDGSFGC